MSYCGAGAHHQNAVVESRIKQVCHGGRTILLHAKRKWPDVISTILWPYAIQEIIKQHIRLTLDDNGKSPLEKFTGLMDDMVPTNFHTWGCPVYILHTANQTGAIGMPKWEPHSHTEIYLGHSPCHAGFVSLVLNLKIGMVRSQFYVIYDDEFATVPYLSSTEPPPNWVALCQHIVEHCFNDQENLFYVWLHPNSPVSKGDPSPPVLNSNPSASKGASSSAVSEGASSPHLFPSLVSDPPLSPPCST